MLEAPSSTVNYSTRADMALFPHHSRANECCQLAAQDPLVHRVLGLLREVRKEL